MNDRITKQLAAIDTKIERVKVLRDRCLVEMADHRGLEGEEREQFIQKTLAFCERDGERLN